MEDEVEIRVTLPIDSDGFLRRECPTCLKEFKWHDGPANEEAERHPAPPAYFCPLCGVISDEGTWWTTEQLDHIEQAAMPALGQAVEDELAAMFKKSKFMTYERGDGSDFIDESTPLVEPDDMQIVASPCHSFEPVKVPEGASGPFHCLICGERFAV